MNFLDIIKNYNLKLMNIYKIEIIYNQNIKI